MIRAVITAVLMAVPMLAFAEPLLPSVASVHGVRADDVLNIREEPSARSAAVGSFAPDADNIEIVALSNGWAQVNTGERTGWVNTRYLSIQDDIWMPGSLPDGLRCSGTEPFWSVSFAGSKATMSTPDAPERSFGPISVTGDAGLARDVTAGHGPAFQARIAGAACSDGMSDRAFGLTASVILDGGARELSGCCRIARD